MSDLYSIPLKDLKPSPRNVRKTGGQSIDDLAASIAAHGLLQNLTVIEAGKGYEVVAGGRRLSALKLLAKQKKLPANYEVPCLLVADDAATEASIAENTVREAMHPADQFEAFRQLIEAGKGIPDTAAAFGVTEAVVRQRLKLANVSPRLLVEYRAGNATLEQMQALAISDDHAAQEAAWDAGEDSDWLRQPNRLRQALTTTKVPSTDHRVVFLGLDAYEAAGGVVHRDLFGDKAYLADAELLDRLVAEKLEATADALRAEGWAWVEVRTELAWHERQEYASAGKPKRRPFTDEEQARYAELEARFDELEEILDNADDDMPAEQAEHARLRDELREMNTSRDQWPAKISDVAGALVYLDSDGINIERGVLKPGQRLGESKDGEDAGPVVEPTKPKKDPADLTQAQLERLWGERTAIIRGQISKHAALAALASEMWKSHSTEVQIGPKHFYFTPESRDALVKHPYSVAREKDREGWQEALEPAGDDVFGWLLNKPVEISIDLIAFCVGENILTTHKGGEFAEKVGINLAEHWQVTEEWLAAQPKAYILAALDEVGISLPLLAKMKVPQLAAEAVTPLKNAGWLPKPLRAEAAE